MSRLFRNLLPLLWVGVLPCAATPALAASAVLVKPLHSPAGKIVFPRLVAGATAAVRQAVNRALARQEKADRAQRADCLAMIREAHQTPTRDSFRETVAATYVSPDYLSLDVRQSYFCATAYPTEDAPSPLTFDLATGKPVDWNAVFKPGFLPHEEAAAPAALTTLYRARYATSDADKDCKDLVAGDDPFSGGTILWLDAARGGLVVQPDFPHVVAACAQPIVFGAAELGSGADAAFLRDLAATTAAAGARRK